MPKKADAAVSPLRPPPPLAVPGQRWEAVQAGPEWRIAEAGKRCRYRGSRDDFTCGEAAAVRVSRGVRHSIDWNYCSGHGLDRYGVWAEGGKVLRWKLADSPPEAR